MLLIDGDHMFVYRVGFGVEHDPLGMEAAKYNIWHSLTGIMRDLKDSKYRIFLSGSNNFREEVATLFPYKGRRKERGNKPKYYQEIRDYLVSDWGAEVINGMEADDALGIEQMKCTHDMHDEDKTRIMTSTIVAADKDLNMIPGWHYNPLTKKSYSINDHEAYKWYSIQRLTGDWECDDVPGLKGIGTKTADKLLSECSTKMQMDMKVDEIYNFKNRFNRDSGYYELPLKGKIVFRSPSVDGYHNALEEISKLVWIRRH